MNFINLVFGPEDGAGSYYRYHYWIKGISFALQVTLFAAIIGIVLGIFIALLKLSNIKILKVITNIYVDIIRGTPVYVQLIIFHMVIFAQADIPRVAVGAIAFGINSAAYVSEIIRAGIQGLDKGQMEAARSLGMSYGKAMLYIIIPQAIKNILPTLVSEFIVLLKETSIVGIIGSFDIMKAANTIISQTGTAIQPLITTAIIYLLLTTTFTFFMRKLERRLRAGDTR
ncbi:amino acid ABC transporter permease [Vallitalea pronyensis]|uniref:Amino acid ABC transporter permease n=2 Tax=Vallitalea pronyensis TaxID=1348613 RepID=A0A8J8MQN7_9FIRM|nr:amino acid ABC transporter permease [Vallitalea pronyensis]